MITFYPSASLCSLKLVDSYELQLPVVDVNQSGGK